jgi:2-iminobutanoate/2-iminopropanoate deaminase
MTIRILATILTAFALLANSARAAEFIEGNERTKARAYSPAVITEGGRIVWLAGMGGTTAPDGKPITDFAAQTAGRLRISMRRSSAPAARLRTSSP